MQAPIGQLVNKRPADGSHIPRPAQFGDKAPPLPQTSGNTRKGLFRRLDPVQSCVGKDRIERLGKGKIPRITDGTRQVRKLLSRGLDHFGRQVDANDLSPGCGNLSAQLTGAAAQVEDALASLGGQNLHQVGTSGDYIVVFGLVALGVLKHINSRDRR